MEKLKERLDAFSDAVIAIIITIMVLELPLPHHNSLVEYLQFGKAIGIFFISFCFVANIWYQHSMLFIDAETMNNKIFVLEFTFLAFLSLTPIFTKLITVDTNRVTVIAYGILTIIVNGLFIAVSYFVIRQKYSDHKDIEKIFHRIYGNHTNFIAIVNVAVLILAYFKPEWALWFYLTLPVISFITIREDQTDLQEVTNLSADDQNQYLQMSNAKLRDFRKQQREISRKYASQRQTNPNWQTDMGTEMTQLFKGNFGKRDFSNGVPHQQRFSGRPNRSQRPQQEHDQHSDRG
ncbi:TMEM175 family protein [Loigolactobacillus backii]|uniref:TMEM175 family protein n=1 Tax=Loigolactobacillus backii TaxID=375175 RepID=UPI0008304484|nr:TMEM175 family protein [Loigolactobacillus backii]MDA5388566.1 TMEM175 family protein [Loigolactobacillus backii]MDA5391020.1 TMEM175 family protein [Loigolactobacillus backii]PIO83322.1 hypothetical protein BSQ39_07025 [Loigolactobacillus backii]